MSTQQAEVQFRLLEEVYITPGTAEEFEASSMARTARMAAGNVAFGRLASVSDDGVYRFLNQLGGDFSSVGEWREQITAMPASPTPNPAAGIGLETLRGREIPAIAYGSKQADLSDHHPETLGRLLTGDLAPINECRGLERCRPDTVAY